MTQVKQNSTMPLSSALLPQLSRNYLLSPLTAQELARVALRAHISSLAAGTMLFQRGDEARHFYLLQSGLIKLYRLAPSGEEKVLELIRPQQVFAEAVMFMDNVYPVHATAVEPSTVIEFDNQDFVELLQENSSLAFRLMSSMSRRIHGLVNEIDQLTLHSGTERLIGFLLQGLPEQAENGIVVTLPASKQVIASRLGMQPETLSRILHKLRQAGLIEEDGHDLKLLDPAQLKRHL